MSDFSRFRQAGFQVALCRGPEAPGACPLVEEGRCELAEAADVIPEGDAGITVLHPAASVGGQVRALWGALHSAGWPAHDK